MEKPDGKLTQVVTCSKCGAGIKNTGALAGLFGPAPAGPTLCDDCYAEERRGGFCGAIGALPWGENRGLDYKIISRPARGRGEEDETVRIKSTCGCK